MDKGTLIQAIGMFLYMSLEKVLGKTKWGSLIDFFSDQVSGVVLKIIKRRKKEDTNMEENKYEAGEDGIKEIIDVIDFADYFAVKAVKAIKDGATLEDLKLFIDPELFQKGKVAIENSKDIPAEIKDLDMIEGGQIVARGVQMTKNIVDALKS